MANTENLKSLQILEGSGIDVNEVFKELSKYDQLTKEEVKRKQDDNYEKWKKEIAELADDPDIDFKGNFIKKHLQKLFGDDIITMSGKTIIIDKGDAKIDDPYTEIVMKEGLDK